MSKSNAARSSEEKAPAFLAGARGSAGSGSLALVDRPAETRRKMKPGLY